MKHENELLQSLCKEIGISLTDDQLNKFHIYYNYLIEKNRVMNLTAITDYREVITKHFIDSIYPAMFIDFYKIKSIIDIGTGAGFPGIPLKIVFPHLEVCLMDSLNKRVVFLQEVSNLLELQNIICIHGRAEEKAHDPLFREQYDLCVSRAVAKLQILIEYCIPFVEPGGEFVSYKSDEIDIEVSESKNALRELKCSIDRINKYTLPGTDNIKRSIIQITKTEKTPAKYPRKAGTPTKKPL